MAVQQTYPVKIQARLDENLSRWLWLVKWFLVIPHYFVLAFLWMAFAFLSVIAFFSILFTGRYPKGIFEFNVGVLRWSWRVAYYAYGALATDRYPPFSLQEEPDYPVHLEIEYPERLSRGLVLVKTWLLAIPHYIVVALLMGGAWVTVRGEHWEFAGFSLIGILTLVAGVSLLFTGRYPNGVFDLLLGLNRWVIRVGAYAGLMTDTYPPFRLDMGGDEPGSTVIGGPPVATPSSPSSSGAVAGRAGWSVGRVMAIVFGTIIGFASLGLLIGGSAVMWADQTQREDGFVTSPSLGFSTEAYAITTDALEIRAEGPDWVLPEAVVGDARVSVTGDGPIFVGIARTHEVDAYLAGVSVGTVPNVSNSDRYDIPATAGGEPGSLPGDETFWLASSEGSGTQAITWPVRDGSWSLVVMNSDTSPGLEVEATAGAEAPILGFVGIAMLVLGVAFLVIALLSIRAAVIRANRPVSPEPAN